MTLGKNFETLQFSMTKEVENLRKDIKDFKTSNSFSGLLLKQDGESSNSFTSISDRLCKDSLSLCEELRKFRDGTHKSLGNRSSASKRTLDLSFGEMIKGRYGIDSVNEYLALMGFSPSQTVEQFNEFARNLNNPALVANVILDAIRLGLEQSPIYSALISRQINVDAATITVPYISGISDPIQNRTEGETIKTTRLKVGTKDVKTEDLAQGIKFTANEIAFVRVDMLAQFFLQTQLQMGQKLDKMAIDILANGNVAEETAPVVGIQTAGTLTYKDIMRVILRMNILGKSPNTILSSEGGFLDILDLSEFKGGMYQDKLVQLNSNIMLPRSMALVNSMWTSDNVFWLIDTMRALQLIVSRPLMFENEKEILTQEFVFVATMKAGFVKGLRDAAVCVDTTLNFGSHGFPTYMDLQTYKDTI